MPQIIRENAHYFSAMPAATIPIGWFDLATFLLGRVVIFTVIPAPPTVIPAQAGIYGVRSYSPSFRFPPTVIPAQAGIYPLRFFRHSDFSVIPACAGIYARNHWNRNATATAGSVSVPAV